MLTVISHDAGGAEILSSYVRQQKLNCFYVLDGPALSIFERKLGAIRTSSFIDAIEASDAILCGTSWQSDLEFDAIKYARSLAKQSTVFLDHWTNFKERFIRKGEQCLPDEIWVGDRYAEVIATELFPFVPVKLVPNPYISDIQDDLNNILMGIVSLDKPLTVLYVCEPVRDHALSQYGDAYYWGYTEEDALRYFLSNIGILGKKIQQIVIRPHPSESREKYQWVNHEFDLPLSISKGTLIDEVVSSDIVVGCQSMAMVIGLLAGKQVISSIPPGGAKCSLPQNEIAHLRALVEENNLM